MPLDNEDCADILEAIAGDVASTGDPALITAFEFFARRAEWSATSRLTSFLLYFEGHAFRDSTTFVERGIHEINKAPHTGSQITKAQVYLDRGGPALQEGPELIDLQQLVIYRDVASLDEVLKQTRLVTGEIHGFRGPQGPHL